MKTNRVLSSSQRVLSVAFVLTLGFFSANADTDYPVLQSRGTSGTIADEACWTSSDPGVLPVAPNAAGGSAFDYELVTNLKTPDNSGTTWYAHTFTVKANLSEVSTYGSVQNVFAGDGGLVLQSGMIWVASGRYGDCTYSGRISVSSADGDACFLVRAGKGNGSKRSVLRLGGSLSGAPTAGLRAGSLSMGGEVVIDADASAYQGKVYAVGTSYDDATAKDAGWLSFGNVTCSGSVVGRGSAIGVARATDVATVRALDWGTSTNLFVRMNGSKAGLLSVSGSYAQSGRVTVCCLGTPFLGKTPILRLEAGADGVLDEDMFSLGGLIDEFRNPVSSSSYPTNARLEVDVDEDGVQTLYFVAYKRIISYLNDSAENLGVIDGSVRSSVTNAPTWSNENKWPTPSGPMPAEYEYCLSSKTLRTLPVLEDSFPGRWLTLTQSSRLVQMTKFLTVQDLLMEAGTKLSLNAAWQLGYENALRGKLTTRSAVRDDKVTFIVYFEQKFALDSELRGNGNLFFEGQDSVYPSGTIVVTNENPKFTGTWRFTLGNYNRSGTVAPSDEWCTTLRLGSGAALGGALPAFDHKALHLDQMSVLEPVSSLELSEPTRGILIGNLARFRVPSAAEKLTVRSPLTVDGQLRKEGDGLLELGASVSFLDAEGRLGSLPRAGSNLLFVARGGLKPLSTNAVDGLAVSFGASPARLVLDLDATDQDLLTYGLYNVKNAVNPLASQSGVLQFEFLGEPRACEVGVATFATKALAETARTVLRPTRMRKHSQTLLVRENDDGTVTVVDRIKPTGFVVVFR